MFRDLTETTISVVVALALIAATYYALGQWLSTLIVTSFDNLPH